MLLFVVAGAREGSAQPLDLIVLVDYSITQRLPQREDPQAREELLDVLDAVVAELQQHRARVNPADYIEFVPFANTLSPRAVWNSDTSESGWDVVSRVRGTLPASPADWDERFDIGNPTVTNLINVLEAVATRRRPPEEWFPALLIISTGIDDPDNTRKCSIATGTSARALGEERRRRQELLSDAIVRIRRRTVLLAMPCRGKSGGDSGTPSPFIAEWAAVQERTPHNFRVFELQPPYPAQPKRPRTVVEEALKSIEPFVYVTRPEQPVVVHGPGPFRVELPARIRKSLKVKVQLSGISAEAAALEIGRHVFVRPGSMDQSVSLTFSENGEKKHVELEFNARGSGDGKAVTRPFLAVLTFTLEPIVDPGRGGFPLLVHPATLDVDFHYKWPSVGTTIDLGWMYQSWLVDSAFVIAIVAGVLLFWAWLHAVFGFGPSGWSVARIPPEVGGAAVATEPTPISTPSRWLARHRFRWRDVEPRDWTPTRGDEVDVWPLGDDRIAIMPLGKATRREVFRKGEWREVTARDVLVADDCRPLQFRRHGDRAACTVRLAWAPNNSRPWPRLTRALLSSSVPRAQLVKSVFFGLSLAYLTAAASVADRYGLPDQLEGLRFVRPGLLFVFYMGVVLSGRLWLERVEHGLSTLYPLVTAALAGWWTPSKE